MVIENNLYCQIYRFYMNYPYKISYPKYSLLHREIDSQVQRLLQETREVKSGSMDYKLLFIYYLIYLLTEYLL